MVDMNALLSDEIEKQLSLIADGEVIDATIKWNDTDETEVVPIAMHGDTGADDGVFFYCGTLNDLRALMRPDCPEDFVVTGFTGVRAKYPRD